MQVTERFLKYVSFDTTSSETSDTVPTTAHQKELGRYLADELARLGLENAHMDQLGYVYAVLPPRRVRSTSRRWVSSPIWIPPPPSAAPTSSPRSSPIRAATCRWPRPDACG